MPVRFTGRTRLEENIVTNDRFCKGSGLTLAKKYWIAAMGCFLIVALILACTPVQQANHPLAIPTTSIGYLGYHRTPPPCSPGITTNAAGAPQLHRCPSAFVLGVTEPPSPADQSAGLDGAGTAGINGFAAKVQHPVAVAADYQGWAYESNFHLAQAQATTAAGAVEEISWEPWDYSKGVNQPSYSDRTIANGTYDVFLNTWAAGAKAYGKPLFVRLGAEMNGTWTSWAVGVNGNTSADYVAMWQHVHDVVTQAGATNVSWVWSPNVSYPGSTPLPGLYPGNGYVDVVALDGYNFGMAKAGTTWQTFSQIFNPDLATLAQLAPGKPVWIAETASAEQTDGVPGHTKPAWITDAVNQVLANPSIMGFAWFDFNQSPTDWRVNSSPASLQAFQVAMQGHGR